MTIPLALEVQDRWGRTIRLTAEVWNNHILIEHNELAGHLQAVRETLVAPDMVRYNAWRADGECFYRFGAILMFPHRYLKIAIRFIATENGVGFVSTAYSIRKIPPKEMLKWLK